MISITASVGLSATNRPEDVVTVKRRLIELGFDWLAPDAVIGPVTINAIRLFQAMKNGFDVLARPHNDGRVDAGGQTLMWLNAVNAPRWVRLTERGDGFVNTEILDAGDTHDFGSSWLDETLVAAGRRYRERWLDANPGAAPLTINDASMPRGGDTPNHTGHETGLVCDVRLPRRTGGAGGITTASPQYDRDAMRAQILAFLDQDLADKVLLIDEELNSEGICRPASGHDNHAHFEIRPPIRRMPGS